MLILGIRDSTLAAREGSGTRHVRVEPCVNPNPSLCQSKYLDHRSWRPKRNHNSEPNVLGFEARESQRMACGILSLLIRAFTQFKVHENHILSRRTVSMGQTQPVRCSEGIPPSRLVHFVDEMKCKFTLTSATARRYF